jgi:NAD(P)-dependent dehydrogenase (short-subunit alcohol dehydrogenase family)
MSGAAADELPIVNESFGQDLYLCYALCGMYRLVINASYGLPGTIEESSAAEVEAVFRSNVFGLLSVTRAVLPVMRKQGSGHIINMSSLAAIRPLPVLVSMDRRNSRSRVSSRLYAELKPLGLHATVVEPGFSRTDFMDASSLAHTKAEIEAYAGTVGKTRSFASANTRQQPSDPAKLAKALFRLAALPDPPVRLPLGPDAVKRIAAKNEFVNQEMDR